MKQFAYRAAKAALATSVAAMMTAAPVMAGGQACLNPHEERADKIRFVQTQFMVAALQCRHSHTKALADFYNGFVTNHRAEFTENYRTLSTYLKRDGRTTIDSYLVAQANLISLGSWEVADFCGEMLKIATLEGGAAREALPLVDLMPVSYQRIGKACPATAVASATAPTGR